MGDIEERSKSEQTGPSSSRASRPPERASRPSGPPLKLGAEILADFDDTPVQESGSTPSRPAEPPRSVGSKTAREPIQPNPVLDPLASVPKPKPADLDPATRPTYAKPAQPGPATRPTYAKPAQPPPTTQPVVAEPEPTLPTTSKPAPPELAMAPSVPPDATESSSVRTSTGRLVRSAPTKTARRRRHRH